MDDEDTIGARSALLAEDVNDYDSIEHGAQLSGPEAFDSSEPPAPAPELQSSATLMKKRQRIQHAISRGDVEALSELAKTEGGLLHDDLRRFAWPQLLGSAVAQQGDEAEVSHSPTTGTHPFDLGSNRPHHVDEEQVRKDVDRSFVHYPASRSDRDLSRRRAQLSELILTVLRRNPYLCYFQGYHDIVQVFLLVLGPLNDENTTAGAAATADDDDEDYEDEKSATTTVPAKARAVAAVEHLSLLRIRDFMLPSISAALPHLNLIPAILFSVDEKLYDHLKPTNPFYALSATLTLYAHNIDAYSDIARLFDFLLASDAATPIYFFVATILTRRQHLLSIDALEEPEILQFTIQKLPDPLDLESLISQTIQLQRDHPQKTLPFNVWSKISRFSVLKTTGVASKLRSFSLDNARKFFFKHAEEIRRQEVFAARVTFVRKFLSTNRRSLLSIALAVFVALAAYSLRHERGIMNGGDGFRFSGFRGLIEGFRDAFGRIFG